MESLVSMDDRLNKQNRKNAHLFTFELNITDNITPSWSGMYLIDRKFEKLNKKGFKISSRRARSNDLDSLFKFFEENGIDIKNQEVIDDYS
jgi:hypothetical protein